MTDALFLSDGRPLADSVIWAIRASDKVRGLLGTCRLSEGQALVIVGARQVHTFGMAYAIDVLFCDADWIVRHGVHRLGPNRITRWVRRAWFVIELPGGAAGAVDVGDRLEWVSYPAAHSFRRR